MQAVILAGGLGTRLSEETYIKPKPMVEIGGKPILWHILKIYSYHGINQFIICCGYKGYVIKEYFANYFLHNSDITFHMDDDNRIEIHQQKSEPWKITLVDTGDKTQTAGRLKKVKDYINQDLFCFTYGDGLSDVNIKDLIKSHKNSGSKVTLTAVRPPGRYGALKIDDKKVTSFQEKPEGENSWINGGFFVIDKSIIEYIKDDLSSWETDVLPILAEKGLVNSFLHSGFWKAMDTLRDKNSLEKMWNAGNPLWKVW